jgi:hypothetical protein
MYLSMAFLLAGSRDAIGIVRDGSPARRQIPDYRRRGSRGPKCAGMSPFLLTL